MAIETLGAALRQIKRLFAEGVISGLLRSPAPGPLHRGARRRRLRGPGGAARADGPERLPRHPPRPERRRGRLPGHLPRPGQEGRDDPGATRPWAAGCTRSRTASRSRPTRPPPGGALREGGGTDGFRDDRHPAPPSSTRSLSALHEEIARLPEKHRLAVVLCDLEGMTQAQAAGRAALERADAPTPAGRGARAAQGPPGPPRPGARRRHARAPCSSARRRAVVPPAWQEATVRAALDIVNPDRRRRGRLGGGPVTHPGGAQDHVGPEADDRLGGPAGRRADGVGGLGRPDLAGR